MRILYIITRSSLAGSQAHLCELLRGFSRDHDLAVITGELGPLVMEAEHLGVEVFVLPHLVHQPASVLDAPAVFEIARIIRRYRPDLVHCHTSKAGVLGRLAARLQGVPSIYTAHGWRFAPAVKSPERFIARMGEWLGARMGNSIITVSASERSLGYSLGAGLDVSLVHNGIADSPLRARPGASGELMITMVARFEPPKDHLSLVRALAGIQAKVRAQFVGDGPLLSRVQAEVASLGLQDRVEFCGQRANVAAILASAHVFVLSSTSEGLPMSIIEALRAGLPVVATAVGGISDCVRQGYNGFLVPSNDSCSMRAALLSLAESPALRRAMGFAGRRLYEKQFTADRMLADTLSVYHRVVRISTERVIADVYPAPLPKSITQSIGESPPH